MRLSWENKQHCRNVTSPLPWFFWSVNPCKWCKLNECLSNMIILPCIHGGCVIKTGCLWEDKWCHMEDVWMVLWLRFERQVKEVTIAEVTQTLLMTVLLRVWALELSLFCSIRDFCVYKSVLGTVSECPVIFTAHVFCYKPRIFFEEEIKMSNFLAAWFAFWSLPHDWIKIAWSINSALLKKLEGDFEELGEDEHLMIVKC